MSEDQEEVYTLEPHCWAHLKIAHWSWCCKCGLLGLKNRVTEMCNKLGCNYQLHPRYQAWLRKAKKGKSNEFWSQN